MTREEQKRYKEMKKYLDIKAKECFKKYNLKKKSYMFYISKNEMFCSVMLSLNEDRIAATFYSKPLWLDDILWDILLMSENKKEPISLRSIGAFTIQSPMKHEGRTVEKTEDIDDFVNKTFKELVELSESYSEDDFLKSYTSLNYQQEVIHIIVLIHNKEYQKALEILNAKKIGSFGVGGKCFSELAIEYINGFLV